jgi:hypothetical protein
VQISGLIFGDGESAANLTGDQGGPFCLGVERTPKAQRFGEENAVTGAENGGVAFKFEAAGTGQPRFSPQFRPLKQRRRFVVDFVPNHNPKPAAPARRAWLRMAPMGDRDVLHPAHVGHVVDVLHVVDIGRRNPDISHLEDFGGRLPMLIR